jgi:xeroderma pigmentosum group C-complementing protein
MPPFVPRKRSLTPQDKTTPPAKRPALDQKVIELLDSSDESSLSDVSSIAEDDIATGPVKTEKDSDEDSENEEDGVDWEDAMEASPSGVVSHSTPARDLELTLEPTATRPSMTLLDSKKGPSKIEREIRLNTHRVHVQCLLFHNALRNAWINDPALHDILRRQLPAGIQKEVQKWRVASALEQPPQPPQEETGKKSRSGKKGKRRASRADRDWSNGASHLEPGQPDLSRGDPILSLLRVLAAYWKKHFKVTGPGLRKHGYRPIQVVENIVTSFQKGEHDTRHGERICDRDELRSLAERREGSRDVGAQLFTALLRALGIEARLVASLQPLGFGWTKAEVDTTEPTKSEAEGNGIPSEGSGDDNESDDNDDDDSSTLQEKSSRQHYKYDRDLPFPIYWTEVISPITHEVIPVDALVLTNAVATTPELVAAFEPRGARAERAKQVIAYVIAHSSDGTAKDVTTRYLRRKTWPGKTKGYRLPVEKIAARSLQRGGATLTFDYDWFKVTMRGYTRSHDQRTIVDDVEEAKDLVANQPDRKPVKKEGDTLQSLRSSTEFVLERFLRREEALRPGAQPVRTFVTGKGEKAKEENVFRRADVLKCMSAESWHKEGRRPRKGEMPLKRVPIRAVTLMRKREVEELQRETGEKPLQGLYARYQTEFIIPPPIVDGVIPKNEYGNMDCFVPSMVPRGAVHIPWNGTARVCRKLNINFAEAVTGFEFGSKMAVPIIEGVVVAEENADLVKDAWRADQQARREKERLQQEKRILQTWRKFLMGLRIAERVRTEYGQDGDAEIDNPFHRRIQPGQSADQSPPLAEHTGEDEHEDNVDHGGGFLLPGHEHDDDQDGHIIVE